MGFKDKLKSSMLNNDELQIKDLDNFLKKNRSSVDSIDPCSDNPFRVSFKDVMKELLKLFVVFIPDAPQIPAKLLSAASQAKAGLSAVKRTTEFLEKIQELGVNVGEYEDGTENIFAKSILMGEEILDSDIIENMKITIGVIAGTVASKGVAVGAGGPMDVTTINNNDTKSYGSAE